MKHRYLRLFWVVILLGGGVRLGLAETLWLHQKKVIDLVLANNPQVKISEFQIDQSKQNLIKSKSIYNTEISGTISYNIDKSDEASVVMGTDNKTLSANLTASQKLPLGVQGKINFSHERLSTNSLFFNDSQFHQSQVGLEATLSLLKNFLGKLDAGSIELSKLLVENAQLQYQAEVEILIAKALQSYWNLVAANYYHRWSYEFEDIGKKFLNITLNKKSIGLTEETDVLAAKASVMERHNEVLTAKNFIEIFSLELKNQLDFQFALQLRTQDGFFKKYLVPNLSGLLTKALETRADRQALLTLIDAKKIQVQYEKNKKLPSLDLFTSLALNGIDNKIDKSFSETFDFSHPNWVVGLQFKLFAQNRANKADYANATLERAKYLILLKQLEMQIEKEVRMALQDLAFRSAQIDNFTKAVALHQQKLDAEMAKFLLGRSASDLILRYQNDYMLAEKQRVQAWLNYHLAYVTLQLAQGNFGVSHVTH